MRHPELCGGLLLTNAIGYDSWPIPSVSAMKALAGLARYLPSPLFKLLLKSLFYRGHDNRTQAMSAYKVHSRPYLVAGGAAALIRQIEQLDIADTLKVADALPRLHIPSRIVWGEDDHFQKLEYGERNGVSKETAAE